MRMSRPAARYGDGLAAKATDTRPVSGAAVGGGAATPCREALPGGAGPRGRRQPCDGDALEAALGARGVTRPPTAPRVGPAVSAHASAVAATLPLAQARRDSGGLRH